MKRTAAKLVLEPVPATPPVSPATPPRQVRSSNRPPPPSPFKRSSPRICRPAPHRRVRSPSPEFRSSGWMLCPKCKTVMTEEEACDNGCHNGVANRIEGMVFKCCGQSADDAEMIEFFVRESAPRVSPPARSRV